MNTETREKVIRLTGEYKTIEFEIQSASRIQQDALRRRAAEIASELYNNFGVSLVQLIQRRYEREHNKEMAR